MTGRILIFFALVTVTVTVSASNCPAISATSTPAPVATVTATVQGDCIDEAGSTILASVVPTATPTASSSTSSNLQTFTGALGGVVAPTVTVGGRGFAVQGNASFPDLANGLQRSCDIQSNQVSLLMRFVRDLTLMR